MTTDEAQSAAPVQRLVGLYGRDTKTGQVWWFTGEDRAPTKTPYLLNPCSYRYSTQKWNEICLERQKVRPEAGNMWWCGALTLFETVQFKGVQ